MGDREFDRQEHNMGGQPDGPYRDNKLGSQNGNQNGSGKNRLWTGVLVGVLVTALVGLTVVGTSVGIYIFGKRAMNRQPSVAIEGRGPEITDGSSHEGGMDFDRVTAKTSMIQQAIDLHFLYDEDAGNVEDFTYRGMLAGLDDSYSTYYTEEDFRSINDSTEGTYSSVGIMLSQNRTTELCTIAKMFEGSPALEARMQPGGIIYKVGDTLVTPESLGVLVNNYIKGEESTDVVIMVHRADKDEYVDMSAARCKIEMPTVEYSMLDGKTGQIAVSEFDMTAVEQFEQVVDELQKNGMKGLIIDLRSNPGGIPDSAIKTVDYILPDDLDQYGKGRGKALTVYTADKNEKGDIFTAPDSHELKVPIVILVDGSSASTSETFTGTLEDYNWATVVGTTSYGEGIIQNLTSLGDDFAAEITTTHCHTPNGFGLYGKGIEPDAEVELDEKLKTQAVVKPEEDSQSQKAVQVLKENK